MATAEPLRTMEPETILSTHLPPAAGLTSRFIDMLGSVPGLDPFVGPDQEALELMLAGFEPGAPA
ncbi:hypothetical protein ABZX75_25425 [Streptomyces sp. NPDC003038]|uniref:hypothetical protein n=1 Tax=unclassified Streptomyces TaxID=2593676 RepID=UPI0033A29683